MKITKQQAIAGALGIVAPFIIANCNNGTTPKPDDSNNIDIPDTVKERSTEIFLGNDNNPATVIGTMTYAQFNGVVTKISDEIARLYGQLVSAGVPELYDVVFERYLTFIVEVEPEGFENWQTIGDGKTVYIALNVENINVIGSALGSLSNNGSTVASALPQGHDKGWQKYTAAEQRRDNRIAATRVRQRIG